MKITDMIFRLVESWNRRGHPWLAMLALVVVLMFLAVLTLIMASAGVTASTLPISAGLFALRFLR